MPENKTATFAGTLSGTLKKQRVYFPARRVAAIAKHFECNEINGRGDKRSTANRVQVAKIFNHGGEAHRTWSYQRFHEDEYPEARHYPKLLDEWEARTVLFDMKMPKRKKKKLGRLPIKKSSEMAGGKKTLKISR